MKHIYKVPGTNKQIIKKPDSSEDVSSEMVVRLDKINEKYGTHFTEMDKVLVQLPCFTESMSAICRATRLE